MLDIPRLDFSNFPNSCSFVALNFEHLNSFMRQCRNITNIIVTLYPGDEIELLTLISFDTSHISRLHIVLSDSRWNTNCPSEYFEILDQFSKKFTCLEVLGIDQLCLRVSSNDCDDTDAERNLKILLGGMEIPEPNQFFQKQIELREVCSNSNLQIMVMKQTIFMKKTACPALLKKVDRYLSMNEWSKLKGPLNILPMEYLTE